MGCTAALGGALGVQQLQASRHTCVCSRAAPDLSAASQLLHSTQARWQVHCSSVETLPSSLRAALLHDMRGAAVAAAGHAPLQSLVALAGRLASRTGTSAAQQPSESIHRLGRHACAMHASAQRLTHGQREGAAHMEQHDVQHDPTAPHVCLLACSTLPAREVLLLGDCACQHLAQAHLTTQDTGKRK